MEIIICDICSKLSVENNLVIGDSPPIDHLCKDCFEPVKEIVAEMKEQKWNERFETKD